jgi:electron transfer flavoprotein alpha subunit
VILVIAEQKEGRLNRATWEAIAAAQQLSGGSTPVKVAVAGQGVSAVAAELAAAAVAEVIAVDHPALAQYTPDAFVTALQQVIAQAAPALVFLPHTYQTRDFSPVLAARMDRALITDVIAVKQSGPSTGSGQGGAATFSRPMFQGKLTADVVPQGPTPHFITIQIGAFRADAASKGPSAAPIAAAGITIDQAQLRQKPDAPFQEAKQAVDLSQAERIVAVGRGIKSQENLAVAEQLAKAFGAELAASRPICDNGWLPMERQIGSSGQTVAPKLYIAIGISGAIQHLVGMKGSRTIVAINKDAEAPIFEVADYGIQGDLFELAPAIIAELEKS